MVERERDVRKAEMSDSDRRTGGSWGLGREGSGPQ